MVAFFKYANGKRLRSLKDVMIADREMLMLELEVNKEIVYRLIAKSRLHPKLTMASELLIWQLYPDIVKNTPKLRDMLNVTKFNDKKKLRNALAKAAIERLYEVARLTVMIDQLSRKIEY